MAPLSEKYLFQLLIFHDFWLIITQLKMWLLVRTQQKKQFSDKNSYQILSYTILLQQ